MKLCSPSERAAAQSLHHFHMKDHMGYIMLDCMSRAWKIVCPSFLYTISGWDWPTALRPMPCLICSMAVRCSIESESMTPQHHQGRSTMRMISAPQLAFFRREVPPGHTSTASPRFPCRSSRPRSSDQIRVKRRELWISAYRPSMFLSSSESITQVGSRQCPLSLAAR